jgi:Derlin-2/3
MDLTRLAAYFPFATIALTLFSGGNISDNIIGIIVGHLYIYLKDVLPVAKGRDYLKTPRIV